MTTNSQKTAMHRKTKSLPLKIALENDLIKGRILDFGCGRGQDVKELKKLKFDAYGYDPHWAPEKPKGKFDTVLMTYVVNVFEEGSREIAIGEAWKHVKVGGKLIVSSRTEKEIEYKAKCAHWKELAKGYLTHSNTFQIGFTPDKLMFEVAFRTVRARTGYNSHVHKLNHPKIAFVIATKEPKKKI